MAHYATSESAGSVRKTELGSTCPLFNRLRRRKEFATTTRKEARLRECVTASRSFAMPMGCHRELTGETTARAETRRVARARCMA